MKHNFDPDNIHTFQIFVQNEHTLKTDLHQYNARAALLVPEDGMRTTYTIITHKGKASYYISGTTEPALQRLGIFFGGLYPNISLEPTDLPEFRSERSFLLLPRISNYRGSRVFSSPFLKTVTSVCLALGVEMMLQVIVCSYRTHGQSLKYGFWIEVGLQGASEHQQQVIDLVRMTVNNMVDNRGISLKLFEKRNTLRIQRNMFSDPFELASFIRLPVDDNPVEARILSHVEPEVEIK